METFLNGVLTKLGPDKGMDLVKGLAAQRNRLYQSHAALSDDALAAGETDVAWAIIAARPIELAAKGAPVAYVLSDPAMAEGNTIPSGADDDETGTRRRFSRRCCRRKYWRHRTAGSPDGSGNTGAKCAISSDKTRDLYIFPALSQPRYKELNRLAEELFVR
jgi:hypothetical protein